MKKNFKYSSIIASLFIIQLGVNDAISSMTSTQGLLSANAFNQTIQGVDGKIQGIGDKVQIVNGKIQEIMSELDKIKSMIPSSSGGDTSEQGENIVRNLGWRFDSGFTIDPKPFVLGESGSLNIDTNSRSWPYWFDMLFSAIRQYSIYNPTNISIIKDFAARIGLVPRWIIQSFDTSSNSGSGYRTGEDGCSWPMPMGSAVGSAVGSSVGSGLIPNSPGGSGSNAMNLGDLDNYFSYLDNRGNLNYIANRHNLFNLANSNDLYPPYLLKGDLFRGENVKTLGEYNTNSVIIDELLRDGFITYHKGMYSAPLLRYVPILAQFTEPQYRKDDAAFKGYVNAPLMWRELVRLVDQLALDPDRVNYQLSKAAQIVGTISDEDLDFISVNSGTVGPDMLVVKVLEPNMSNIDKDNKNLLTAYCIIQSMMSRAFELMQSDEIVTDTAPRYQALGLERQLAQS